METLKSEHQKMFDELRHLVSCRHQVPEWITLDELQFMLMVMKNIWSVKD